MDKREPVIIKETSLQAFHKRLAELTNTEAARTKTCSRAEIILRYEANKKSREVKLVGDFEKSNRFELFMARRASGNPDWWSKLSAKIDL